MLKIVILILKLLLENLEAFRLIWGKFFLFVQVIYLGFFFFNEPINDNFGLSDSQNKLIFGKFLFNIYLIRTTRNTGFKTSKENNELH